jgi:hypothetical protein
MPHRNSSIEDNCPNILPFDLDNNQEDTNMKNNKDDATSSLNATAELMQWHL